LAAWQADCVALWLADCVALRPASCVDNVILLVAESASKIGTFPYFASFQ
jgi:hypothetical protein